MIVAIILLIISFFLGYFLSGGYYFSALNGERQIRQSNLQLKKEKQQVLKTSFKFESDLQFERKINILLKQQMLERDAIISKLKNDLSFYRGIVDGSSKNLGVFFQRISIIPYPITTNLEALSKTQVDFKKYSAYRLNLSLIKKIKKNTFRRGAVKISFYDKKGKKLFNQGKTVGLWKILDEKGKIIKKISLRFQSFINKEVFLLVDKTQVISKIKIKYSDNLRADTGIFQEFNWQFPSTTDGDIGITYVGK